MFYTLGSQRGVSVFMMCCLGCSPLQGKVLELTKISFRQLKSQFIVLLGDLNWDMLNTPAILQSKLDGLNLTQIINEPTRYNPKSVNTGTLIDILLNNSLSKYTSAVFNLHL